ncbi:unnamed protein product [Caenorhabditis sp. 36 PRJEB53466]|nr:unnamed protein product [Caenorhabditis sp. 36 PRJEB53466]
MEVSTRLLTRKRRNSDSTPPITKYFASVKRERSISESKNVSQKLDETPDLANAPQDKQAPENVAAAQYNQEELRRLLGLPQNPYLYEVPNPELPAGLENLPKNVYSHILTILDLRSVSALSLVSMTLSSRVRCYVADNNFYRRIQMDHLDFMDSSIRPDDEEFEENDPFIACGALIKSITITLDTKIRAQVFLNICRNLRHELGGSLHGFGRLLETVTQFWKFSERRVMVKAAILIDSDLRRCLIKVLTSKPGQYVGLEMRVRSGLIELFLNRNQDIDENSPDQIIEFGSWLSVLLRNVMEKYQGRLYYLLFGPTKSSRNGERIDWAYFCVEDGGEMTLRKSEANYKKMMTTLLNGIRALRVMNNAKNSDMAWNGKKIYQLFLRIIEVCEMQGTWSEIASSTSLAIDTAGLFSEYLVTCLNPHRPDYANLLAEAAEMVCIVRTHLYRWSATPATFLAEPLHHAFNHLAQLDGHYGGYYKAFLEKIWKTQKARLTKLVASASNTTESSMCIRQELDAQLSTVRLLTDFSEAILIPQVHVPRNVPVQPVRVPNEEDEQQE